MPKPELHVVIVGAGLGGLAAAIAVTKAGHRVTVLEQAPVLGEIGAGIQIPPNSSRLLKRWGLLEKIEKVSVRPRDFLLRSYRDGAVLSAQNMLPYAIETYGVPYLHIHRADYHRILVDAAKEVGVDIRLGCAVRRIDFEKPAVYIRRPDSYPPAAPSSSSSNQPPQATEEEVRASLVIGADGLKSICREALLGHADPPHLTGDLAYRIVVRAADMSSHPLLQPLVEKPAINYWMGPSAHAVCYLLQGGGLYNIVLICPDNLPEMVNTAKADLEEMRALFEGWDPRLKALLGIVQETSKWRLQNSEEMRSWSHPAGRFSLLGDACHATLPYLAQGAAMAIEDAAVLGALLARLSDPAQLPDVLTLYESLRKPRTTRIVKGSTALRDVFHMPDGARQRERDRQLVEAHDKPFEGFPNRWRDPVFQPWLFGYDVDAEVDGAWKTYLRGEVPGTEGAFAGGGAGGSVVVERARM
ncbi:MAG: hypothetical protein M1819_001073 [Sarea resinae]|nr:MAG: hypothetical protein M1819_001073 [Sarea resinae]